jgi:hypothetical protein
LAGSGVVIMVREYRIVGCRPSWRQRRLFRDAAIARAAEQIHSYRDGEKHTGNHAEWSKDALGMFSMLQS